MVSIIERNLRKNLKAVNLRIEKITSEIDDLINIMIRTNYETIEDMDTINRVIREKMDLRRIEFKERQLIKKELVKINERITNKYSELIW